MLVKDLLKLLQDTIEVHPEAEEAQVWADAAEVGFKFQVKNLIYSTKKGQPKRVILLD